MGRQLRRRVVPFLIVAIAGGELAQAAADVIVLRSTGPSARRYPAGQRLPDSASFALRPGDQIVLLGRGGTRVFRGPGVHRYGVLTGGVQLARISGRITTGAVRGAESNRPGRAGVGATRGSALPAPQPENVWHYDVSNSGTACVPVGRALTLWRPAATASVVVTLRAPSGEERAINWPAGQATLALPGDLRVADDQKYQVQLQGAPAATRVNIRFVPADLSYVTDLGEALLERGCRAQLDTFVALNLAPEDPGR